MRQSFAWWSFTMRSTTPPGVLLSAAASIGYEGVEMLPQELWTTAHDLGLRLATMTGHEHIGIGFNDEANHDDLRRTVESSIEAAAAAGIGGLIVFAGNRRGLDDERAADVCADGLSRLVGIAADAKVPLLLELLNSKIDHPGYQCDSTAFGRRVVDAVGSPWLRLLYDVYHMQVMEGDVTSTLRQNIDVIGHVHTAGVPGRRDIDNTQELNYPAILFRLARDGYAGWVGHEFIPRGDPVEALRAAYELCAAAGEAAAEA